MCRIGPWLFPGGSGRGDVGPGLFGLLTRARCQKGIGGPWMGLWRDLNLHSSDTGSMGPGKAQSQPLGHQELGEISEELSWEVTELGS